MIRKLFPNLLPINEAFSYVDEYKGKCGDAVNAARRMESHGMMQIKSATYERVNDELRCESRGTVDVKGKGEMEVFMVRSANEKPVISMSLQ